MRRLRRLRSEDVFLGSQFSSIQRKTLSLFFVSFAVSPPLFSQYCPVTIPIGFSGNQVWIYLEANAVMSILLRQKYTLQFISLTGNRCTRKLLMCLLEQEHSFDKRPSDKEYSCDFKEASSKLQVLTSLLASTQSVLSKSYETLPSMAVARNGEVFPGNRLMKNSCSTLPLTEREKEFRSPPTRIAGWLGSFEEICLCMSRTKWNALFRKV